jgi:glycosyltransferase involved in cell wall biosynthesis/tetratricopeptide (TPR) repeat protein
MVKLALCLIVKAGDDSEFTHLQTCLQSVAEYVDGIFINLNHRPGQDVHEKMRWICKEYDAITIETEWNDNFAEARNANFAQVTNDFTHILWLDTDDTVDKPQKLRRVCEEAERYDSIYADYLYDKDEEGNPLTVHMVARLLKNNGGHEWKGSIHETLVETRSVTQGMTKDFTVIHHADAARKDQSLERNVRILEKQIESEQKDPDPRTFYYLGSTYIDMGQNDAAKQLLSDYLDMSGWDQERGAAETKIGKIYLEEGNRAEAKKHFMLAIGEDPDNPDPKIEMGSLELEMKSYHKARRWLEEVVSMEKNMTTLERNPMGYTFRTYLLLADVYLNMGGKWLEKSKEFAQKAAKYKKKDKTVRKYVKMIDGVNHEKKLLTNVVEIAQQLKKNKEDGKLKLLAQAVPRELEDNPIVLRLREPEPFKWPEKSVVIMTGDTAIEEWGPWSLKDGIGGSEEAIIRLSKHLSSQGYRVVVFGKVGNNGGLHDGVMWRNFWECNLDDEFDIFVAWRAPFMFERKINARKSYLWLHDVMEPGEFTQDRIENFTKCIVLSNYHRSLFPMIPDEKILLSANGIDPDEFTIPIVDSRVRATVSNPFQTREAGLEELVRRDPHKMIYTSSHVRGLAYIYEIWSEVKKAVPDATLDVFYGRESYDAIHKGNPERMKWMDDMMAKAKSLEGVIDHGKVGQREIVRRIFESGIWVYPCPFPEIYCITAIKMQAGGAVPVASNFAALDETIKFGHKQEFKEFDEKDLESYKEKLIWWLTHPEEQEKVRRKMMEWARTHSWESVAKQWVEEFEI